MGALNIQWAVEQCWQQPQQVIQQPQQVIQQPQQVIQQPQQVIQKQHPQVMQQQHAKVQMQLESTISSYQSIPDPTVTSGWYCPSGYSHAHGQ